MSEESQLNYRHVSSYYSQTRFSTTIGVEFGGKVVNVGGKSVKLQTCFLLLQSNKILTTL